MLVLLVAGLGVLLLLLLVVVVVVVVVVRMVGSGLWETPSALLTSPWLT
jgi:hypothetical protein